MKHTAVLSPKEQKVLFELTDFFINGGETCVACMVEKYWGLSIGASEYDYYDKKQRRILSLVNRNLKKMKPSDIPVFAKSMANGQTKMWLLAINVCKRHPFFRSYKILNNPADHEIVSNLTAARIEGMMVAQEERVEEAVKRWPKLFGNKVKYIRGKVPYLLNDKVEKKDE